VQDKTRDNRKSVHKLTKITSEIVIIAKIHGKITASTVKSEHGSENPHSQRLALVLYHLHFGKKNKHYEQQLKSCNVEVHVVNLPEARKVYRYSQLSSC